MARLQQNLSQLQTRGIRNLLIHGGIIDAEPVILPSVNLDMPDDDCFVISENDGLIEPTVDLGDEVQEGQVVARIWPPDRTGVNPIEYRARRDGLMSGRHFPGLVKPGDCIGMLAVLDDG